MESFKRKLDELVVEAKLDNKKQKLLMEAAKKAKPPAFKATIIEYETGDGCWNCDSSDTPEFPSRKELLEHIMRIDDLVGTFIDNIEYRLDDIQKLIDQGDIPKDWFEPLDPGEYEINSKFNIEEQFDIFVSIVSLTDSGWYPKKWEFEIEKVYMF